MRGWRTILKYSNKDYPDGNRMGDIQIFEDCPLGSVEEKHIWVFVLDPVIGKEIAKIRPIVVVSNDINNEYSGNVTVPPITSASLEKVYRNSLQSFQRT